MHLSTRSAATELYQSRLNISDNQGIAQQILPAIHLGGPYQSIHAPTRASDSNVPEATKKPESKHPPGTQHQEGCGIVPHQNWLGRSSRKRFLRRARTFGIAIENLVDECLHRPSIGNRLRDIRDEFVHFAAVVEILAMQLERWSSLTNATVGTLPFQPEEIVAHFADSFGTRRDFLLFCLMEKDLQLSKSVIRRYFSLIASFCLRRHLARGPQVTPTQIVQLYTRPNLLQIDDRSIFSEIRSSAYHQTIRSLYNLQLAIVGFEVFNEMPAINAKNTLDFKEALNQARSLLDRTGPRCIPSQTSKDPSRLPSNIVDTKQKGTYKSPKGTITSDDEVKSAAGGMPPSSMLIARNKQEQTRTHSITEAIYPETQKSRRLCTRVKGSLIRLLEDFKDCIRSPRSEFQRRLALSWFQLERGGDEVSKLAHEARFWCRFRERWAELAHGQKSAKRSMDDLLTDLHTHEHREFIFAFKRSWDTLHGHFYVLDRMQYLYRLMSMKEHRARHARVFLPLRKSSNSIQELLNEFLSSATPILLAALDKSWVKISLFCMGASLLRKLPSSSKTILDRYLECHRTIKDLRNSLHSLGLVAKTGSSASGSICLGGPLRQYLVWEPPREQQGGQMISYNNKNNNNGQQSPNDGSIPKCEISRHYGSQIEELSASAKLTSARRRRDRGEQYNQQRGNGTQDSRRNIVFGFSRDQRTWQPSSTMHFSTSTPAPGLHGSLSDFDVMLRSGTLASQTRGGRCPLGDFSRKSFEQLAPLNRERMDGEDQSPRSWPSYHNVRPHFQSGGSYKGCKIPRPKGAAFHTSSQASGSSSAPNEEIATADRSRSGEGVLHDDSNTDMHPSSGPLGYQIPSNKMGESMPASSSSPSAYWKYTSYEGPKGQKVKVHYCRSLETTERIARLFLDERVIGFDIEWKPSATAKDGIRQNVALVQLASEERIALFHIARFSKDDSIESLVAPTFKAIMESPSITKVGVSVKGDCTRLRKHMNIDSRGLFELSYLYKLVKFSLTDVKRINRRLVALATQVEEHFMLPMSKDESVRGSDWSEELNYEQISYAASDSYAGFQLYYTLNNKRLALSPCPPLPTPAELGLPIRLANGQTVADYEEPALEEAAPEETDANTALQPSTEELDEAAMNLEIEDDRPSFSLKQKPEAPKPKPKPTSSPSPPLPLHPSIIAADEWISKYRASSSNTAPTTHPPSSSNDATYPTLSSATTNTTTSIPPTAPPPRTPNKPRATPAFLRAYFLFNHHTLSIPDIASLLRDPPLLNATVASYILETARLDGLDLPPERINLCLECLPEAAKGRYRWLGRR
ncbi:MAG: hypothetical protein L6R36_000319 [Xanthoria steineri]|nr:MAG: hypothetical protein L6R36_000319 [Xanthoria steineri]